MNVLVIVHDWSLRNPYFGRYDVGYAKGEACDSDILYVCPTLTERQKYHPYSFNFHVFAFCCHVVHAALCLTQTLTSYGAAESGDSAPNEDGFSPAVLAPDIAEGRSVSVAVSEATKSDTSGDEPWRSSEQASDAVRATGEAYDEERDPILVLSTAPNSPPLVRTPAFFCS